MSRIRQMNEQKAGKQNTSTTQQGYYGGKTTAGKQNKGSHGKSKGNPHVEKGGY